MELKVIETVLEEIQELRALFLQENNFQFVYNKCHEYGWATEWAFFADGEKIGYGSVWGADKREDRDAIFEFYLIPAFRNKTNFVFEEFCSKSGATIIECQSNDRFLSPMLYEYAQNINAEAVLFEDHIQTCLAVRGAVFGRESSAITSEREAGDYFLKQGDEVVATGGFMLNYNKPYADIYMEVMEPFRHKGFGSLIVQELKKEIYLMDRVPAARCNIRNKISKATLLKAGFKVCGAILKGRIISTPPTPPSAE